MPSVLRIKNPDGTWYEVTALKGDTGITPNLQVGTVTTGNPGTSAEVTITGTPEEPVLNFKIPKGEPGTGGNGGAAIDDTTPSTTTTYSSSKIESELVTLNEANAALIEVSKTKPNAENTELWIHPNADEVQLPQIDDSVESVQDTWSSKKIAAAVSNKANEKDLASVAKSGSYTDLRDKPTIPTVPSTLPNPNALTFTGAVNETYDGSAAKSVSIPTIPESLKNPNKLILSGAVTAEYDGSAPVSVEIPAGGGYNLPIASPTTLGGVMPAAKTDDMTQSIGVDGAGRLWTSAGSGDGEWTKVVEVQTTEDLNYLSITEDMNGNPLSFDEAIVLFVTARQKDATSNGTCVMSVSPQWASSFNSRGIYSLPLNKDAYSYAGYFKIMGDFILQNCILRKRVAGSIDAVTSLTYGLDSAGCNGTNAGDVQCATIRTSRLGNINYFNSEGKMYGITIGTDMLTSIMIAKGSRLGVWVR